jgi:hypothetical protein
MIFIAQFLKSKKENSGRAYGKNFIKLVKKTTVSWIRDFVMYFTADCERLLRADWKFNCTK